MSEPQIEQNWDDEGIDGNGLLNYPCFARPADPHRSFLERDGHLQAVVFAVRGILDCRK